MIHSFQVRILEIDEQDPWSEILATTMFTTRATYTMQAMPMQLVFGRDAMLNVKFDEANWVIAIHSQKQQLIDVNNCKEKAKRISH